MNKEILVVDDERDIRELCRDILETEGFSVELASDGEEALQKMQQFNFVIFIIDIIMPKIDGLELISRIKKRKPLSIIIVTTGFSSIEGAVRAVHAGAFQYLSKPLSAPELIQAVKKGLEFYNFLYGPLTKTIEPLKEVDKLKGIMLFNEMSEEAKKKLQSISSYDKFLKGSEVLDKAEEGFFIVQEGEISVWYNDNSIEYLTKGDSWGEETILGENASFSTLRAETDVEILFFKMEDILSMLAPDEKELFFKNIMKSIYYKWIKSVQRISMLKTLDSQKIMSI